MVALAGCNASARLPESAGFGSHPELPDPNSTLIPTVNIAPAIGWPARTTPRPASGLKVQALATKLEHPRWVYVLPNGDVLVAESDAPPKPDDNRGLKGWLTRHYQKRAGSGTPSADRITLLRDVDGQGRAVMRTIFLDHLHSPFGMVLVGDHFYVADTDAVLRFDYLTGETRLSGGATKIVDLPAGRINHHWTKNLIASADGTHLYITVGSNSNEAENGIAAENERAAVWEVNLSDNSHRIFASGLRNPNGLAWEPHTGALWTVVNERDELGSDLVPDYMTALKDGAFYGWPYSYYGPHVDPHEPVASGSRRKRYRAGLRAGVTHGLSWPCLPGFQCAPAAVPRRHVHRAARLVEPATPKWLQGRLHPFRARQAAGAPHGCGDGIRKPGR